jgi:hypothetical protein
MLNQYNPIKILAWYLINSTGFKKKMNSKSPWFEKNSEYKTEDCILTKC